MSKNRNRAKLKKAMNNHQYRIIWINYEYPLYWDEGIRYHNTRTKNTVRGSKKHRCWKRKEVMHYQYRMYRTWKYNRMTRWKQ